MTVALVCNEPVPTAALGSVGFYLWLELKLSIFAALSILDVTSALLAIVLLAIAFRRTLGKPACLAAAGAAASWGRRSRASAPLPVSPSTYSAMIVRPLASANR